MYMDGHICWNSNRRHLLTSENKLPFFVFVCSKQKEVCHFHFPCAAKKLKLQFSVSSLFFMYIYIYGKRNYSTHTYIYIYMYICCCLKRKRKTEAQVIFLIHLPFAYHEKESLLFVRCLAKKQKEVIIYKWKLSICKRTKQTKRTKRTCPSMVLYVHSYSTYVVPYL